MVAYRGLAMENVSFLWSMKMILKFITVTVSLLWSFLVQSELLGWFGGWRREGAKTLRHYGNKVST